MFRPRHLRLAGLLSAALAVSAVIVVPLAASASPTCSVPYVVKKKDSPWTVAQKTRPAGMTILVAAKQIKSMNPKISAWQIGKTICLPAGFGGGGVPPAETSTTTSTTTAPPVRYSKAQIVKMIRDTFPDDVEEVALYVVNRESNFNPRSRNKCCFGLFQIHRLHVPKLASVGVTSTDDLLDPVLNIKAAYRLWLRNGKSWGPWCTKGLKTKFPGLKGCS